MTLDAFALEPRFGVKMLSLGRGGGKGKNFARQLTEPWGGFIHWLVLESKRIKEPSQENRAPKRGGDVPGYTAAQVRR